MCFRKCVRTAACRVKPMCFINLLYLRCTKVNALRAYFTLKTSKLSKQLNKLLERLNNQLFYLTNKRCASDLPSAVTIW